MTKQKRGPIGPKSTPMGVPQKKEKLTRIPIYFGKELWTTLRLPIGLWRSVQGLAAQRGQTPAELILSLIMNRVRELDPEFAEYEKRYGKAVAA